MPSAGTGSGSNRDVEKRQELTREGLETAFTHSARAYGESSAVRGQVGVDRAAHPSVDPAPAVLAAACPIGNS